ncbi:MAG: hypothetical protein DI629_17105 [Mesorhizobium amorphae]|nr:MAG: hypothetical protein DI629_17105 [Mesorhizobium amorphae]
MMHRLGRFTDEGLLRWMFRGLLVGTIGVLALDFQELGQSNGWWQETELADGPTTIAAPPDVTTSGPVAPGDTTPFVPASLDAPRGEMAFALEKGGVLSARGTIDPKAAERFAAELDERGEYVKTVLLDSPGGSLEDALRMGRAIRERELRTSVPKGAQCASSCPLVLAGGVERAVAEGASVGVHQIYAAEDQAKARAAQAMSDAQSTTARISRYLSEMGVDPAVWLHALDTPPRALYRLSAAELAQYRLSTGAEGPVAEAVPPPS